MNNRRGNQAFTLIEMLIALAMVGLIVTMVYGSYAATSRSLSVYNSRMTCSERAYLVLRLMARQIRCAYTPSFQAGVPSESGEGRNSRLPPNSISRTSIAVFRGDPDEPGGEILCFTTTGGLGLGPDRPGGLSRVSYRYDARTGTLSVSCVPCVHTFDNQRDSQVRRPVLSGISSIELEFHDGHRWQQAWSSGKADRLPRAVRIALTIIDESGRTHHYGTTVPVALGSGVPGQQRKTSAGRP
jgi:type II secretion system protein J